MGLEPSIELDAWDVSGMFLDFPGLWDGMDSGIGAISSGTLGTCLGCPWASQDSGMGWTVGLEPPAVGHSGRVPGLPGTQGWDGQLDWSPQQWDTRDMSGMSLG